MKLLTLLAVFVLFAPGFSIADEDSELRAEILGEQAGKLIAGDHTEYKPEIAKAECRETFYEKWEEHFKEKGFDTDPATVDSFVLGCMNKYNKKFGK
ncbi:MAG: hypothetical protein AAF462_09050 [Thermodesulfobacteriota bacterium]